MGNIPKNRDREELLEEFSKHARKSPRDDKTERMRTYKRDTGCPRSMFELAKFDFGHPVQT